MQIFLICDVALDDKNAQNIHVIELFNNLSKVADVCLFVPKPKKIKFKFPNIKYVPWVFIPIIGLIFYHINLLFYLFFYCKKIRVDAIYVRQSEFSFVPLIISKYFGISYVVEINGLILDEMKMSGYSKLIISFAKMSEKNGYKHAIKIVAVTQGVKEGIMKLYNIPDEKIIVIGNGANIELFKPINEDEAKSELKLDQDVRYVCFVGNIVTWQGVGYLVLAAPSILLQCPNTRFLIVGDGSMKSECMHQAKELGINDKFIFTGSVPYEKVPLYINASDICVAPFIINRNMKIGLSPLKVFEYMACEKPIVSSEILNLEFIEQQNVGILVKPEDPEELAKAIIKLLNDEELRKRMGKNGRDLVVRNYSWEANARKVADVCENLINKIVE